MIISHIVAVSKNDVIGDGLKMPWQVEGELSRFARLTLGKTVIMGRKTYCSLPSTLPGRDVIVLSKHLKDNNLYRVASSIEDALQMATCDTEVFIAGGGQIYAQTLNIVDKIYLTFVEAYGKGGVVYPTSGLADFKCVYYQNNQSNINYSYTTYLRCNCTLT